MATMTAILKKYWQEIIIAVMVLTVVLFSFWAQAATPCHAPHYTAGWGQTFQNTSVVQGFNFDQANNIMWTVMRSGLVNWFFIVPQSVAQAYSNVQNLGHNIGNLTPDSFYQTRVENQFHWGFLDTYCNELLTPQGTYLWIK